MNITLTNEPDDASGICRLVLEGDMTIYTAETMHQNVSEYVKSFDSFSLKMDKVEEIDSTGIQLLLAIKRHAESNGGTLLLANPSACVVELIELFGLSARFD